MQQQIEGSYFQYPSSLSQIFIKSSPQLEFQRIRHSSKVLMAHRLVQIQKQLLKKFQTLKEKELVKKMFYKNIDQMDSIEEKIAYMTVTISEIDEERMNNYLDTDKSLSVLQQTNISIPLKERIQSQNSNQHKECIRNSPTVKLNSLNHQELGRQNTHNGNKCLVFAKCSSPNNDLSHISISPSYIQDPLQQSSKGLVKKFSLLERERNRQSKLNKADELIKSQQIRRDLQNIKMKKKLMKFQNKFASTFSVQNLNKLNNNSSTIAKNEFSFRDPLQGRQCIVNNTMPLKQIRQQQKNGSYMDTIIDNQNRQNLMNSQKEKEVSLQYEQDFAKSNYGYRQDLPYSNKFVEISDEQNYLKFKPMLNLKQSQKDRLMSQRLKKLQQLKMQSLMREIQIQQNKEMCYQSKQTQTKTQHQELYHSHNRLNQSINHSKAYICYSESDIGPKSRSQIDTLLDQQEYLQKNKHYDQEMFGNPFLESNKGRCIMKKRKTETQCKSISKSKSKSKDDRKSGNSKEKGQPLKSNKTQKKREQSKFLMESKPIPSQKLKKHLLNRIKSSPFIISPILHPKQRSNNDQMIKRHKLQELHQRIINEKLSKTKQCCKC